MSIFKVGDKVRRIKGMSGKMVTGDIGTVKKIVNDEWMEIIEYPEERHLIDRFELIESREYTMEEKISKINEEFNKIAKKHNKHLLERAKDRKQHYYIDIKRYERCLKDAWTAYKEAMIDIKIYSQEAENKDYTSDIEAILNHKYVKDISMRDGSRQVVILTDYIDIYDEQGNKFKGNKYKLTFDYDDMTCYIEGLDEDYNRKSYWTEQDPHPHVDGNNGEACWGSAGSMLSENMNNYELYASFIVVLNFLQQVNTSDPAGEYIRNWDCIDEDGNDLENPYDSYATCHICDAEMNEDNSNYCEDCDNYMCDDHSYWIDYLSKYVCEECFEEGYRVCGECSERIHKDDAYWHGDDSYCEVCYEEKFEECYECGTTYEKIEMNLINDEWYCDDCYEEKFADCDECGYTRDKEDTFYCNICCSTYCTSCKEEVKEGVCEDCYEGEEYICESCGEKFSDEEDVSFNGRCEKCYNEECMEGTK